MLSVGDNLGKKKPTDLSEMTKQFLYFALRDEVKKLDKCWINYKYLPGSLNLPLKFFASILRSFILNHSSNVRVPYCDHSNESY